MDVVPDVLVQRWQAVYREYMTAAQTHSTTSEDHANMARLSADVATAWRQMATTPELEWWMTAALTAAAEAFEQQARECDKSSRGAADRPMVRQQGRRRGKTPENWVRAPAFGNVK